MHASQTGRAHTYAARCSRGRAPARRTWSHRFVARRSAAGPLIRRGIGKTHTQSIDPALKSPASHQTPTLCVHHPGGLRALAHCGEVLPRYDAIHPQPAAVEQGPGQVGAARAPRPYQARSIAQEERLARRHGLGPRAGGRLQGVALNGAPVKLGLEPQGIYSRNAPKRENRSAQ